MVNSCLVLQHRLHIFWAYFAVNFGFHTFGITLILLMSSFSPWRIVDDCGGAFSMGILGGGIFQAVRGFRNAPLVSSHTMPTKNTSVFFRFYSPVWFFRAWHTG